ncbi:hypothetical protein SBA4_5460007 [Candidatus Sulfopaludibacter sp. SbA4]|nr:hypothetical protein SBA4_5460007 [Candidatus Sulfopaludibacter sp. SbA4]
MPLFIPVVISMRSSLDVGGGHVGMLALMIFSGSIFYGVGVFLCLWALVWRNESGTQR